MLFLKGLAVLISFFLSFGEADDEDPWNVVCGEPEGVEFGWRVHLVSSGPTETKGVLFFEGPAGLEKIAEYPCSSSETIQYFDGNRILLDCFQPESWDNGFDLMWVEGLESKTQHLFVHELNFAGPILRGRLNCENIPKTNPG
ncbi:MAG: hypothetical protein IPL83_08830 [Bdellovibrionales bacterium]|nr:hypothetical protein [Bdellovibrionales bacterium]